MTRSWVDQHVFEDQLTNSTYHRNAPRGDDSSKNKDRSANLAKLEDLPVEAQDGILRCHERNGICDLGDPQAFRPDVGCVCRDNPDMTPDSAWNACEGQHICYVVDVAVLETRCR